MAHTHHSDDNKNVPKRFLPDFLKAEKFVEQKKLDKAAAIYRRVLKLIPRNLVAGRNLGSALAESHQLEEALVIFQQILQHHPDEPELYYNLGVVLQRLHRTPEALAHYEKALQLKPDYLQTMENLAALEMNLGHYKRATEYLHRVLEIAPTRPGALFTLSLLMLLEGDWHDGWHLYEYRWETPDFKTDNPDGVARRWVSIEDIRNRSVLLVREQGLGDTLQFCRYALVLARYGAKVSVLVQPSLKSIVEKSLSRFDLPYPITVLTEEEFSERQHYDYWLPMLSVPLALIKDYPKVPSIAKYLFAEATEIEHAKTHLPHNGRLNIGLVWSGNPTHKNDQHRSAPFEKFARLLSADANFHILQTEIRPAEENAIRAEVEAGRLIDHRSYLTDFRHTAALLECMDLLIAVDTSVVHLAGALGRPTWIALAYTPDFRWLLEREDSPWYPSVRLLRQSSYDDWDGLLARIEQDLQSWLLNMRPAQAA